MQNRRWLNIGIGLSLVVGAFGTACAGDYDRGGDGSGARAEGGFSVSPDYSGGGESDFSVDPGTPGNRGSDPGGLDIVGEGTARPISGNNDQGDSCGDLCEFLVGCIEEFGLDDGDISQSECVRACTNAPASELACVRDADTCSDLLTCSDAPGQPSQPGEPVRDLPPDGPSNNSSNSGGPGDGMALCADACNALIECGTPLNCDDVCDLDTGLLECIVASPCEDLEANCQ